MRKFLICCICILCLTACTPEKQEMEETAVPTAEAAPATATPTIKQTTETTAPPSSYSYNPDDPYYSENDHDGDGKINGEEFQDAVNDFMDDYFSGNSTSSSASSSASSNTYWCMGKGDTCTNKTSSAYDFYCNSCDPDGDNREG